MGDFYFVFSGGEPSSAKVSADIEMWELIKSSKDPTDFESFLRAFPNSQFAPIARIKLKRLKVSEKEAEQQAKKSPCLPKSSLYMWSLGERKHLETDEELLERYIELWCPNDPVAEKRIRNLYEHMFEKKDRIWEELSTIYGITRIECVYVSSIDDWCVLTMAGPVCELEQKICYPEIFLK